MKSKYFFIAFIAACTFNIHAARAQDETPVADKADSVFASYLSRIEAWSNVYKYPSIESDSLVQPNIQLMKYAKQALTQPQTIISSFPKAVNKGLMITTSEDGKLRFYSWDTWVGGSMHIFNSLLQYMVGDDVKVKVLSDIASFRSMPNPGAYSTDITTIYTQQDKTVYMITDCSIASDNEKAYEIKAYSIENGTIEPVPFFKQGKMLSTSINYAFNAMPGNDSMPHEFNMIHMSSDKSKLFVPIISSNGTLSDYFAEFKFDGHYFVLKRKTKKG